MIKYIKYSFLFFIYFTYELIKYFTFFLIIPFRFKLIKFLKFKLDNDFNPFSDNDFEDFINKNKKLWKNYSNHNYSDKSNILAISFIHSHAGFSFHEALISKYLSMSKKKNLIGIIRKQDIKSEVIFRSYGIRNILYFNELSFFNRIYYFFKTLKILNNCKNINDFLNIRINGIEYGKTVYEHLVRHTGIATFDKLEFKFFYYFSKCLYIEEFCNKLIKKNKIDSVVQSESQFIPYSIFFQFFLNKDYKIYARHGSEKKISIRVFSNLREANTIRAEVCKNTFEYVSRNFKQLAVLEGAKHIQNRFLGLLENQDTGSSKIANKNKRNYSKDEICELNGWDTKKKIACIYSHALIDGNYLQGWRIFRDNLTWLRETLNFIKRCEKYNWLIKPHPIEIEYDKLSKTNTKKEFNLLENFNHIKLVPDDISNISLLELTDFAITCNGTAALEYASFGKKSLMAGRSDFSDIIFKNSIPNNKDDYFKGLKNLDEILDISNKQIEDAKIYTFLQWRLNLIDHPLNPDKFEPNLFFDEKSFWIDASKKIENYNENDDYFKKMLSFQIENNYRHTPNLKILETN